MYVFPYQGIWFYSPVALLPFFTGGALLIAIMQQHKQQIRLIYCADLAGAGIGAVSSIVLMSIFDPITTISLLVAILFGISVSIDFNRSRTQRKFVYLLILRFCLSTRSYHSHNTFRFWHLKRVHQMYSKEIRNQKLCIPNGIHSLVLMYTMMQTGSCYILLLMGCCFSHIKIYGDLNEVDYLRSTTSFLAFEDTLDKNGHSLLEQAVAKRF